MQLLYVCAPAGRITTAYSDKFLNNNFSYGHFAKRVFDYSSSQFLRQNSKRFMYVVNVTILFYQLGMCSVAILFISDNMVNLLGNYIWASDHSKTIIMASVALVFIMATNM